MNNPQKAILKHSTPKVRVTSTIITALVIAGAAATVHAQGDIPSGTIGNSGSGPFNYTLSFTDSMSATSPIGSIWYSWVPGAFFLPSGPSSVTVPSGWTDHIVSDSIQFVANSSANYITPGETLSGFGYTASFSPSTLAAAPNSAESVAYAAGIQSDSGMTFFVQAVPEPGTVAMFATGAIAILGLARRKSRA